MNGIPIAVSLSESEEKETIMAQLRMDKILTEMGLGSRSQVKQMIARGRVTVDGVPVKRPEIKTDPETAHICVDGAPVAYAAYEYYMLHKPAGYVSATEDSRYPTVVSLITEALRDDLFPVGRLDVDTEGLLIITNDGALAHDLLSPKKHVAKTYQARVTGQVTEEDIAAFAKGLDIGEKTLTRPAGLRVLSQEAQEAWVEVTVTEGKYHQVKRMFASVDKEVLYLKRIAMGSLALDDALEPGQYRPLHPKELEALRGTDMHDEG